MSNVRQHQDYYDRDFHRSEHQRVKLSKFWPHDPEAWFLHAQSRFRSTPTSDQKQFDAVIEALDDVDLIRKVSDIITNLPTTNKYETLKTSLISRLSDSRDFEIHQLLEDLQLGNKKHSELLREMRRLAKKSFKDDALQKIWRKRLPANAQLVLSTCKGILDELAETADVFIENMNTAQY